MEYFTIWIESNPVPSLILLLETIIIVIGGFITWWHNFGLKKEIRDLKKDNKDIKDLLLDLIAGKTSEEQQEIIQKAKEKGIDISATTDFKFESEATVKTISRHVLKLLVIKDKIIHGLDWLWRYLRGIRK